MSIQLENITKYIPAKGGQKPLFLGLDLKIDQGERVAVLALPKSGKTTLLKLICGTERSYSGNLRRDLNVSWPVPMTDFVVPTSSIAWNVRSVARLYGVKDKDLPRRVAELGGLKQFVNLPLSVCPPYARQQLGFGLGIAMDFDLHLFDNMLVPARKEFKEKALEFLRQRMEGKAILLVTSNPANMENYCETFYVLEHGRLSPFSAAKEAAEYFKSLQKAEAERLKELGEKELEEEVPGAASEEDERSVELVQAGMSDMM